MTTRVISITFLALATAGAAAQAHDERVRGLLERLPPLERELLATAKDAGHYAPSAIVDFSNRDGRWFATFHLPDELVKQFADPAPLLLTLEGSPHLWSLHRRKSGTLDPGLSMVTLTCYVSGEDWPFNRFVVSSDGQGLVVSAAQMAGRQTLLMTQNDRALHLGWRFEADKYAARKLDVADVGQLPTRVPAVMDGYLLPVLRRLGPARPASDVYRVFDRIPADPRVTAAIAPLLARLDADDPVARDAAAAGLRRMGRSAILACLRTDASALSPEQRSRLDAVYASDGWLHVPDVEAARSDERFLAACLEDEDGAVRSAASNMLAAVRTIRQLRR